MSVQCLQMATAMKIRDGRKIVEKLTAVFASEEKLGSCG